MSTVFFLSFILLAVLSLPIAFSLGLAGVIALLVAGQGIPLTTVPQRMFTAVDSFPFLAVPFFVLVGEMMSSGGVTRRLIDLAGAIVGAIHGGLAIVTQIAGSMMDAMSGSSAASTAAMSSVMLPEMVRENYDRAWAGMVVAASGVTGIIPGFLIVLSLCLLFAYQAKRRGYPVRKAELSMVGFFRAFRRALLALFIPIMVLGGIYGGMFTPTEAGAVAAVYTFLLVILVYRALNLVDVWWILVRASVTTAAIMIVVGGANILGFVVTFEQVPQQVAGVMLALSEDPTIVLLILMVIFLLAGMFITASAAVVILVPIVMPVVAQIGVDPIFFGVMAVVNLGIGTVTPPLGINLFIVSGVGGIPMDRLFRELGPVLAVLLLDLVVFLLIPDIVLFLPEMMRG